ncbi:MAG: spore cortex biosynthesis protein YabQ [Lysinibacillus sp.]
MIISEQFIQLVVMVMSGIIVGFVIDSTRLIVVAAPKKSHLRKMAVVLELFVWLALGGTTFYLLFWLKDGAWRIIDPLAQLLGIFLYQTFLQSFFRFIGRMFVLIVLRPILWLARLIVFIIRKVFQVVIGLIIIILRPFVKIYSYLLNTLFKNNRYLKYNKKQE